MALKQSDVDALASTARSNDARAMERIVVKLRQRPAQ